MTAMLSHLQEQLGKLTDELIDGASSTSATPGFQEDYQGTSIGVIFEQLRESRDLLVGLDAQEYFSTWPYALLSSLATHVSAVLNALEPIAKGQNVVDDFAVHAEMLRAFIMDYGLDRVADEEVSYEQRKARLNEIIAAVEKLRRQLNSALRRAPGLEELLGRSQEAVDKTGEHLTEAQSAQKAAEEAAREAQSALEETARHRDQATDALADVTSRKDQVATYHADLEDLYKRGQDFRVTIVEQSRKAQETIDANTSESKAIIERLTAQQDAIQKALEHAIADSLFYAYDVRQRELQQSKEAWFKRLLVALVFSGAWAVAVMLAAFPMTADFYARLLLAPVFGFAVAFSATQYRRERHLEEVYAFKSKVSLSLEAYRGLIERVLAMTEGVPEGDPREKYAQFVIDSVEKVFVAPFDHSGDQRDAAGASSTTEDALAKVVTRSVRDALKLE